MSHRFTFWLSVFGVIANVVCFAVWGDWWLWIGAVMGLIGALLSVANMDRAS